MTRKLTAAMLISMLAAFASTATAGDRDERRHDRDARHEHRDRQQDRHHERRERDRHDVRDHRARHDFRDHQRREHDDDRRHYSRYDNSRHDRYHAGAYRHPHGYRQHRWYAGARLPTAYYAPRYVVHNYHTYHLHRPPYGHHWVRVDNDVVLAAIATGVVLQVVDNIFW